MAKNTGSGFRKGAVKQRTQFQILTGTGQNVIQALDVSWIRKLLVGSLKVFARKSNKLIIELKRRSTWTFSEVITEQYSYLCNKLRF